MQCLLDESLLLLLSVMANVSELSRTPGSDLKSTDSSFRPLLFKDVSSDFDAVGKALLCQDVADVSLNCSDTDNKLGGDLLVAETSSHCRGYLLFGFGKILVNNVDLI